MIVRILRRAASVALLIAAVGLVPRPAYAFDCPATVLFSPAENGGSTADTGWTGIGLDRPIFGNMLSLALACGPATSPCGSCPITDAVADPNGTLQRCVPDTAIKCAVATEVADCGAPGACKLFITAPQPASIGGVGTCYTNHIEGGATGSVNVETGAVDVTFAYVGRFFFGDSNETPCARCDGDPVLNDGLRGGTCVGGARDGLACDGNGAAQPPYDADWGTTSFDCPPTGLATLGTLSPGPVTFSTSTQTRTLDASTVDCTNALYAGKKCFCDTCNNVNAEPCQRDADCPMSGGNPGICGGLRCDQGPNDGAPCATSSECPSGQCKRYGEHTQPNGCLDDTNSTEDCADTGTPGDGLGECTAGPIEKTCANHPRGCTSDGDCDGVPGACVTRSRACYLTDGTIGDALSAVGAASPLLDNQSTPTTLGMIACQRAARIPAIDTVLGLPGLARNHHVGTITMDAATIITPCPPAPDACRVPTIAGKSRLQMKDREPDDKDQLRWKWSKGAATTLADLGDPTTDDDYALCVYDTLGLRAGMFIPAGGLCDGKPCWKATSKGFVYKRKDGSPRGVTRLKLQSGEAGKASIQADGKGSFLPLAPLQSFTAPLQVQVRNQTSGLCWGVTFAAPFDKLTETDLQARD